MSEHYLQKIKKMKSDSNTLYCIMEMSDKAYYIHRCVDTLVCIMSRPTFKKKLSYLNGPAQLMDLLGVVVSLRGEENNKSYSQSEGTVCKCNTKSNKKERKEKYHTMRTVLI
jgi:succinate dehydrogenase/fumarate reductase-like Fe-S protein